MTNVSRRRFIACQAQSGRFELQLQPAVTRISKIEYFNRFYLPPPYVSMLGTVGFGRQAGKTRSPATFHISVPSQLHTLVSTKIQPKLRFNFLRFGFDFKNLRLGGPMIAPEISLQHQSKFRPTASAFTQDYAAMQGAGVKHWLIRVPHSYICSWLI